jgi:hypothetical protein
MTLHDILAAAEKATGPDMGLDAAICLALNYLHCIDEEPLNLRPSPDDSGWLDYEIVEDGRTIECSDQPAPLTASIDAALALVERVFPGEGIVLETHGVPVAGIGQSGQYPSKAPTPPLAIITALLRALITSQESNNDR